jgi:hypothetical protein
VEAVQADTATVIVLRCEYIALNSSNTSQHLINLTSYSALRNSQMSVTADDSCNTSPSIIEAQRRLLSDEFGVRLFVGFARDIVSSCVRGSPPPREPVYRTYASNVTTITFNLESDESIRAQEHKENDALFQFACEHFSLPFAFNSDQIIIHWPKLLVAAQQQNMKVVTIVSPKTYLLLRSSPDAAVVFTSSSYPFASTQVTVSTHGIMESKHCPDDTVVIVPRDSIAAEYSTVISGSECKITIELMISDDTKWRHMVDSFERLTRGQLTKRTDEPAQLLARVSSASAGLRGVDANKLMLETTDDLEDYKRYDLVHNRKQ